MSTCYGYVSVDIDIDDIVESMNEDEKEELFDYLANDLDKAVKEFDCQTASRIDAEKYLGELPPYEIKKILCNVLDVPSYLDNKGLRDKLENIINAV